MSIEKSSRILSILSRSLTHVIRGDLSVITNDLTYLAGLVPAGEVERAKTRCANIGQFLGKLAVLQDGFTPNSHTLAEFSKSCLGFEVSDSERCPDSMVWCDPQKIQNAFGIIANLIDSHGIGSGSKAVMDVGADVCTVVHSGARIDEPLGSYRTLSDFAGSARGERSVVDAALGDLIFEMHGWSAVANVKEFGIEISVVLPCNSGH